MSLSAQSFGQEEEEEEEEEGEEVSRPLFAAQALLNQAWPAWEADTRPGWDRMDSRMSEVPGTRTTASRETHRACLRQSHLSRSNPIWIWQQVSYIRCCNSRVEPRWKPSTIWLFLILALKLLNSPLIFPRYSKVDTK